MKQKFRDGVQASSRDVQALANRQGARRSLPSLRPGAHSVVPRGAWARCRPSAGLGSCSVPCLMRIHFLFGANTLGESKDSASMGITVKSKASHRGGLGQICGGVGATDSASKAEPAVRPLVEGQGEENRHLLGDCARSFVLTSCPCWPGEV